MDAMKTRGLAAVLAELDAAGLDDDARNVRCLIDSQAAVPASFEEALRELESAKGATAELAAVRAKLLIELGRPQEAIPLLAALAGRECRYPVLAWHGQSLLLAGRFDEAVAVLDRAAAADEPYAWARFFRAAAKLGLGDAAGAAKDAAAFLKSRKGAASLALAGVAEASAGRRDKGAALLRRAADAAPGEAWPCVLESVVHRAEPNLAAARDALKRAAARKPSAWVYAELAEVYEHLGILPEAIENAAEAVRLCPCVEHHRLKAHLHGCWRENAEQLAELGRALALRPGEPALLFERSKARSAAGKLPEALRDAAEAARLSPSETSLACWQIQLLALTGDRAEADRRAQALLRRDDAAVRAQARFCLGYSALCEADAPAARRELDLCLDLSAGTPLRPKAEFYRVLADLPRGAKAAKGSPSGPGLLLIGLGVDPPYTATAGALLAISRCDVVFNNVMGDEMFEFLRPFCRDARPVAYHQNNDEEKLSAEMLAEVRPGRTVAFVTRGSAIVQGPLGTLLLQRCRERGIEWNCAAAVSSAELLDAKFGAHPRPPAGMAVLDSRGVGEDAMSDPRLPLTLFLNMFEPDEQYPALCARLKRQYGAAHPCLILDHVIGQLPRRATIAELPGLRALLSHSAVFFIPGRSQ